MTANRYVGTALAGVYLFFWEVGYLLTYGTVIAVYAVALFIIKGSGAFSLDWFIQRWLKKG